MFTLHVPLWRSTTLQVPLNLTMARTDPAVSGGYYSTAGQEDPFEFDSNLLLLAGWQGEVIRGSVRYGLFREIGYGEFGRPLLVNLAG